jgi:2-methylcitrate dehydratase PrpD
VLEGLGESWRCLNIIFKVYPTGGWNQALIDCTRQLVIDNDIKPDEIEHVHITVSSRFADHFLHGRYERMFRPESGFALHGSWPCAAAMAILHRRVGVEHMTLEEATNPEMLAIADKITCEPGPIRGEPEERPITVAITTKRGTFSGARTRSSGYPSEVTPGRIAEKFRGNAALVLPEHKGRALEELVFHLEDVPDVRQLSELLSP